MNDSRYRSAVVAIKASVCILVLYWLVSSGQFDIELFWGILSESSLTLLSLVVALQALSVTIVLSRWKILANAQSVPITWGESLRTGYQGLASGLILPGSIGIDGIRALHSRNNYRDKLAPCLSSILMDRLTGFVGLILLGLVASCVYIYSENVTGMSSLIKFNAAVLLAVLLASFVLCITLPKLGSRFFPKFRLFQSLVMSLKLYANRKLALALAVLVSMVGHLVSCLAWMVAIEILGASVSFAGVTSVTSILMILQTLPITPLGLGTTDIAAESIYGLINVDAGAELQMLIRLMSIIVYVACAAAFFRSPTIRGETVQKAVEDTV